MKKNPDGLPMKDKQNVPLTAGVDEDDPSVTLHDKAIPEKLTVADGREFNLRESHDFHERVEYPLMQSGLSYDDAHRLATEAEHCRIRSLGFDPNEIERLAKPFIDRAQHRAQADAYVAHPSVDNQPYRDSGEEDLLNRGPEHDTREFYDAKGACYYEPEQYRAIGKVDFVIGMGEDHFFHVIEPSTATPWLKETSRPKAERAIDRKLRKLGVIRAKELIDAATPWSQQQLQALYRPEH